VQQEDKENGILVHTKVCLKLVGQAKVTAIIEDILTMEQVVMVLGSSPAILNIVRRLEARSVITLRSSGSRCGLTLAIIYTFATCETC